MHSWGTGRGQRGVSKARGEGTDKRQCEELQGNAVARDKLSDLRGYEVRHCLAQGERKLIHKYTHTHAQQAGESFKNAVPVVSTAGKS